MARRVLPAPSSPTFYAGANNSQHAQHFCYIRLLCTQSWCDWSELEQPTSLQGLSLHWEVGGLGLAASYQEFHSHPLRKALLPFESNHPRLLPSHYTASNMLPGRGGRKLQMNQLNWQFRRMHKNWQWLEVWRNFSFCSLIECFEKRFLWVDPSILNNLHQVPWPWTRWSDQELLKLLKDLRAITKVVGTEMQNWEQFEQ